MNKSKWLRWTLAAIIGVALFMAGWATHLVADNIEQANINHSIHVERCQMDGTDTLGFGPADCSDVNP